MEAYMDGRTMMVKDLEPGMIIEASPKGEAIVVMVHHPHPSSKSGTLSLVVWLLLGEDRQVGVWGHDSLGAGVMTEVLRGDHLSFDMLSPEQHVGLFLNRMDRSELLGRVFRKQWVSV